jgi:hypothetical protein
LIDLRPSGSRRTQHRVESRQLVSQPNQSFKGEIDNICQVVAGLRGVAAGIRQYLLRFLAPIAYAKVVANTSHMAPPD